MPSPGISGLAVALAATGGVLLWSGLKNATVDDTVRALLKGQPVPSGPGLPAIQAAVGQQLGALAGAGATVGALAPGVQGTPGLQGGLGSRIAQAAMTHQGAPYVWATGGPNTFDCSGLVNQTLGRDLGLPIPGRPTGQYTGHGPVSGQYYVWSGAVTVTGPPQPGDLVCYIGHIGIAVSATHMCHAPKTGDVVKIAKIWSSPGRIFRRVKGA